MNKTYLDIFTRMVEDDMFDAFFYDRHGDKSNAECSLESMQISFDLFAEELAKV